MEPSPIVPPRLIEIKSVANAGIIIFPYGAELSDMNPSEVPPQLIACQSPAE